MRCDRRTGEALAAAAWPLGATAQQRPTMRRVGVVTIQQREAPIYVAFDQRLRDLGFVVEFLNPGAQIDGLGEVMKELVRRKVDVILHPPSPF
jgi:hypothetical protein